MSSINTSRRHFFYTCSATAAGLTFGFHAPASRASPRGALTAGIHTGATQDTVEMNAWVRITSDNRTVLKFAISELGQGSSTSLPMLIAEELECDWARVEVSEVMISEHVKRNFIYRTTTTFSSDGVRGAAQALLTAGATARTLLTQAAAQRWQVPVNECVAAKSIITHRPTKRTLSYGDVAADARSIKAPETVALKSPKEWKLVGTSVPRIDIPDKVIGKPMYGIDVIRPSMLHAAIAQCPVFGGRVKAIDATSIAEVKQRKGIKDVLNMGHYVAVVGNNWWRCNQAIKVLKIDWDDAGNHTLSSDSIKKDLTAGLAKPAGLALDAGNFATSFSSAPTTLEAEFFAPYLDHAPMEPMNCTAEVKDGFVTVWAPTQGAGLTSLAAAKAAGVSREKVEVFRQQVGGAFGRRGQYQDFTQQAVEIAMRVRAPVKLLWSREEDIQHGHYRPATLARMQGALSADGKLVALSARVAMQSILEGFSPPGELKKTDTGLVDPTATQCLDNMPYAIPNLRVEHFLAKQPVPVGVWRAVARSQNSVFRECFIDELAALAKRDPYEFRLDMLSAQTDAAIRDRSVLQRVASETQWKKPLPANHFHGIAVQDGYGSHTACVVEIKKLTSGAFKIERVTVVVDCGQVAHPDAARAQIEGCVIFGLTAALYGEITIKEGRVEQSNFHDYRMLKMSETPIIIPILAPSGGFWGGMGEPPMAAVPAALLNAIFSATGKMQRSLPLSKSDVKFGDSLG